MKLLLQGGNVMVTLPRAMVRELGLAPRGYVTVQRGAGRSVIVAPLEVADERRPRVRASQARADR